MNNLIEIPDNSRWEFEQQRIEPLRRLSGVPIKKILIEDNPNLLVFPQNIDDCLDKIQDSPIITIEGENVLCSGNIMGFVGIGNTRLRIYSRFATEDKQDYFLHYMLQRVFSINLFDLQYNSDSIDIFDFLIYLFPTFLKRACQQGLYKEYQTRNYNNTNIKGRIDISKHIRENMPYTGRIAYQTREYAFNNDVTQLVRHTIEYIRQHHYAGGILQNDADTKVAVKAIEQATPAYNRLDRTRIIHSNLRPIYHPYYNEYRNLQQLCLQILRHEELKYGSTDREIYGILFDGAWLWEEYLATILTDFKHPRNKIKERARYLFEGDRGPRYPDFFNHEIVLDAKYKSNYQKKHVAEIDRDDIHQIICYMWMEKMRVGGFVSPTNIERSVLSAFLRGYNGEIRLYQLLISSAKDWTTFTIQMRENENVLMDAITSDSANIEHSLEISP